MDNRPIGIFDSGLGAFSVLLELLKELPGEDVLYFGDTLHSPYGHRGKEDLQQLCFRIVRFLEKKDIKALIVACNTATAAALPYLQERFDLPIVGVISPGCRKALSVTKNKKIGIVSTLFTASHHAYRDTILRRDPEAQVYEVGSRDLASLIENGFEYNEENDRLLKDLIAEFPQDIDTLVMGCTHYPLVRTLFEKYFPPERGVLVDPGRESVLQLSTYLEIRNKFSGKEKGGVRFFVTGPPESFISAAARLVDTPVENIEQVSL